MLLVNRSVLHTILVPLPPPSHCFRRSFQVATLTSTRQETYPMDSLYPPPPHSIFAELTRAAPQHSLTTGIDGSRPPDRPPSCTLYLRKICTAQTTPSRIHNPLHPAPAGPVNDPSFQFGPDARVPTVYIVPVLQHVQ